MTNLSGITFAFLGSSIVNLIYKNAKKSMILYFPLLFQRVTFWFKFVFVKQRRKTASSHP